MEFAQEVIEECAAFPFGDHDDLVDSMTQAVMRFRQGGFLEHPEDAPDEPRATKTKDLLLMGLAIGRFLAAVARWLKMVTSQLMKLIDLLNKNLVKSVTY